MLDNSSNVSTGLNSAQGPAIWQSEWIETLWAQLSNGTYSGIGNVVLDESVSQSEAEVLADLEAIDRMLLGSTDIEQALSEVQQFA
ncbi:hypothetical protein, partial [cf. Phormidesmis sp. LEGE 11477]|uniref:hypothetical protein n=1 Tax=cf. Phormidesmis sp. LEGE 11477 TaxID=1828680 RepID=UPI001882F410